MAYKKIPPKTENWLLGYHKNIQNYKTETTGSVHFKLGKEIILLTECVGSIYSGKLGKLKRKVYGPFSWIGFNRIKPAKLLRDSILATTCNTCNYYHATICNTYNTVSWSSLYSFDRPLEDERLSWTSSQVNLKQEPLDWRSSAPILNNRGRYLLNSIIQFNKLFCRR